MNKRIPPLRLALAVGLVLIFWPYRAGADDLYVSIGFNNTIVKVTPDGTLSNFANTGLNNPWGLAFDGACNLYAANRDNSTIMKFTPGGVGSAFATAGLSNPWGLAFDSAGNLYAANQNNTIEKFSPDGVGSVFASTGLNFPTGLAFDHAGNLFVANSANDTIQKFTPGGVGSLFADSGLHSPYGLAVDSANNLYATNSNSDTIQKFTPDGVGAVFASSGLSNPFAAAFDSAGNFYTGNYFGSAIRKFTPGGVGSMFAGAPGVPHFMAFAAGPSPIARVAGFATPIPEGTGNFTSLPGAPGYSSSGQVAFYGEGAAGQSGVYRMGVGPPIKVADLNTAIPNGTGNFTAFFLNGPPITPSIDGASVAFFGVGGGGQQGIYVSVNGPPIRVADAATAIPGGTGSFTSFLMQGPPIAPSPVISGNNVAFFGAGSGGQQGIYVLDYVASNGPPIKIADTATLIPDGTGTFTAIPQEPSISGDNVAFLGAGADGQQGIYRAGITGPPIKVADLNTDIPGGTGTFTEFMANGPPIAPAIDGASVAFFGAGSGGQQGIYVSTQGPPIRVADTSTAIPGGTGSFTGFGDVSLSATDVAFLGFGASGQAGIYDMTGGSLVRVVAVGDVLGGRAITGLNLSRTGLFGDPLAFQATFADGSQGVFTAAVPRAGDFNGDGEVDGDDLAAWATGFGTADSATHMQGDADGDLDVDGADFLTWQRQFGNTASAPMVAAVPEPISLAISLSLMVALGASSSDSLTHREFCA